MIWRREIMAMNLPANIYHPIGFNPHAIVYNHLNLPSEMVRAT
jgi:hypothetical protein